MKQTVLVVEDEFPLLDAITEMIEKKGFAVYAARSGEEVFACLKELPNISAVWLDHYILGKENGLDIVTKMKESDQWKNIPVFVVSNTATGDKISSYIQLGIDKFYVKSEVKIHDVVDELIGLIEKE